MKFGWGGFGRDWRATSRSSRAARKAAGDDVDLLIDVGLCWDLRPRWSARNAGRVRSLLAGSAAAARAGVGLCRALRASPIRIACESAGGFWESLDASAAAGFTSSCPMSPTSAASASGSDSQPAATEGAWCVPHCFSTGILSAASLHLLANQPEMDLIECSEEGSPLNTDLVRPALRAVDGYIEVPDQPGLGVELDEDIVSRFRVA